MNRNLTREDDQNRCRRPGRPWLLTHLRDAVANRLGPSIKTLGPVRFPPGTSMIGGQKSGSVRPGDRHIAHAALTLRFA